MLRTCRGMRSIPFQGYQGQYHILPKMPGWPAADLAARPSVPSATALAVIYHSANYKLLAVKYTVLVQCQLAAYYLEQPEVYLPEL